MTIGITEKSHQNLRKELTALFEAKANGDGELKKAETRLAKLERMERNLSG